MEREYRTENFVETQKLGKSLAEEILVEKSSEGSTFGPLSKIAKLNFESAIVICLEGDLGAGKTTFTQGLLKGLGAEGPHTSPTFVVMKQYSITRNSQLETQGKNREEFQVSSFKFQDVYHIDAYRVSTDDVLHLGWEELISEPKNIIIVEWSERITQILPENCLKIKFEWMDQDKRKITFE